MRAVMLVLLALAVWFLCQSESQPQRVADINAPAAAFSAARAEAVLARILGPEKPHPVGSAENAAVRARIQAEFAQLAVQTETYSAFTCRPYRNLTFVSCATVTDIIADVAPGEGKAIVLLAHYDSVPAGPGASDDESGVATVLETVRALKAAGTRSLHPIIAVITDGEEGGLLGANAFLQNETLKARVGVVVNVEARGTKGPSLLFQTSPGDGRLIDLYAKSVPVPATSSLYAEIYKVLPNDTDLTLFIRDGFTSFNFAFADNVRYYHSPFDIRTNLDPGTLQMQGDNMLGVASALETTDFRSLKGGNDIYMSLQGWLLPRLPAAWALPLSIAALLILALSLWVAHGLPASGWRSTLAAAAMPLAMIVGSGLFGWLLSLMAQLVSGHPDPTYAHPLAMRAALGFAVLTVTLLGSRMVQEGSGAGPAWLWTALLAIVTAILLPGISPYFLFPALVAALFFAISAAAPAGWFNTFRLVALLAGALAALFVWFPLVVSGETLMGLRLHPLFTIPAALAAMTLVPLLAAQPMSRGVVRICIAVSSVAALALAVVAGLQPAYSKASPQRVNIVYLENGNAPARWIADTSWKGIGTEPIPEQLRNAGPFTLDPDAWEGLFSGNGYVTPAGAAEYPVPTAQILRDEQAGDSRIVELVLHASSSANGMALYIPEDAQLVSIDLRGQQLQSNSWHGDTRVACLTSDCQSLDAKLVLANKGKVTIRFAEIRYGIPISGARLQSARPDTAMASQSGDETILANVVTLPAR
jgi:hypothetical protein